MPQRPISDDEIGRVSGYLLGQAEKYSWLALWPRVVAARIEFLNTLERVSAEQAAWKPGEQDWSVEEVAQHVLDGSRRNQDMIRNLSYGREPNLGPQGIGAIDPAQRAAELDWPALVEALQDDSRLVQQRDRRSARAAGVGAAAGTPLLWTAALARLVHVPARPRPRPRQPSQRDQRNRGLPGMSEQGMRVAIGMHRDGVNDWESAVSYAQAAEQLGVYSIWSAEAWGHDAITPLAYLAGKTETIKLGTGIIQGGTRTPALVGMTAMSLQSMSGGRFMLGLGTSGPQVVEGWHGVPFAGAVSRLKETAEIVRIICSGERLVYEGRHYTLPLPGGRKARRSAPARHRLSRRRFIWRRWARAASRCAAKSLTAGSARRSSPKPPTSSSTTYALGRSARGAASTSLTSKPPPASPSPTIQSAKRRATRGESPSRSARWAQPRPTSTTTPSADKAGTTPRRRCNASGSRVSGIWRGNECRLNWRSRST